MVREIVVRARYVNATFLRDNLRGGKRKRRKRKGEKKKEGRTVGHDIE